VLISTQHGPEVDYDTIKRDVIEHVIKPVIPAELLDSKTNILSSHRKICDWRAPGRLRTYRKENNC